MFFLHANTYETYNLNFHVNFVLIFGVFRPFAAPSKCRPVRPAPPSLRHWQHWVLNSSPAAG